MSPYQIHILLHYYACVDDYPADGGSIQQDTLDDFIADGLLELNTEPKRHPRSEAKYRSTRKLDVYCYALIAMPLPKQYWLVDVETLKDNDAAGCRVLRP